MVENSASQKMAKNAISSRQKMGVDAQNTKHVFPRSSGNSFFLAKNMILGFDLGDRVIIGLESQWNSTMNGLHMLERMDKLVLLEIFL